MDSIPNEILAIILWYSFDILKEQKDFINGLLVCKLWFYTLAKDKDYEKIADLPCAAKQLPLKFVKRNRNKKILHFQGTDASLGKINIDDKLAIIHFDVRAEQFSTHIFKISRDELIVEIKIKIKELIWVNKSKAAGHWGCWCRLIYIPGYPLHERVPKEMRDSVREILNLLKKCGYIDQNTTPLFKTICL